MRVKWLRQALRNLDEEAEYLAKDSPRAAAEMFEHARAKVDALGDFPAIGRPGSVPGTRELVIEHYSLLVPYRVAGDELHVLRVFHTRRRPPKAW